MASKVLFAGNNTNLVYLSDLKNELTNAFINNAAVSATLLDADNVPVEGPSWPAAMSLVAGSDGDYVLALPNTLNLVENALYTVKVTAVAAGDMVGEWDMPLRALHRG
jgi:hypothetical protein